MRAVIAAIAVAFCLAFATPAHAWNCSDPLAERVLVPSNTTGTYGDGDGQLASYNGQLYECEVVPVSTPSTGASNAQSTSNSTSNSNSASSANSQASSGSSSVATGGNSSSKSSATGGNATGGNASVTNSVEATGGTGGNASQHQSQNQSVSNSGNSSSTATNGGQSNEQVSETIVPRQTATAYSPLVTPTSPCTKGYSGGGQGPTFGFSFGAGKIDENCAILETSRLAPSLIARCKVYLTDRYVRNAGVTLDDCLQIVSAPPVTAPEPQQRPITVVPPAITVNVPAPVVTVIPPPVLAPVPSVAEAAKANGHVKHTCEPTVPKGKNPCKPTVYTNENIQK